MLFARFDWFLNLGISSTILLLAASGWKKCRARPISSENEVTFSGIAIKLVLYILKQLFASVSVTSGGYLPRRSGSVNIHRYSPPLLRIIVKYGLSERTLCDAAESGVETLKQAQFAVSQSVDQQWNQGYIIALGQQAENVARLLIRRHRASVIIVLLLTRYEPFLRGKMDSLPVTGKHCLPSLFDDSNHFSWLNLVYAVAFFRGWDVEKCPSWAAMLTPPRPTFARRMDSLPVTGKHCLPSLFDDSNCFYRCHFVYAVVVFPFWDVEKCPSWAAMLTPPYAVRPTFARKMDSLPVTGKHCLPSLFDDSNYYSRCNLVYTVVSFRFLDIFSFGPRSKII